jgi:uncharacterized Fe-S cluster-containing radical SAM superfamily protein
MRSKWSAFRASPESDKALAEVTERLGIPRAEALRQAIIRYAEDLRYRELLEQQGRCAVCESETRQPFWFRAGTYMLPVCAACAAGLAELAKKRGSGK